MRSCTLRPFLLAAALVAADLPAQTQPFTSQVQDGWYAISSCRGPTVQPGYGGLLLAHPRQPGPMTDVGGLPPDLTGELYNGTAFVGANSVTIHPDTGELLVGETNVRDEVVELHRIALLGAQVWRARRHVLGVVSGDQGGVVQTAWRSADELLVAGHAMSGPIGSPSAAQLAIVDLVSGAVTPVPLPAAIASSGTLHALACDATSQTVYLGVTSGGLTGPSRLWSFPLANPQSATQLATLSSGLRQLAVEAGGTVLASSAVASPGATPALVRIDPTANPATVTPLLFNWDVGNAMTIEPTTGQVALAGAPTRPFGANVAWVDLRSTPATAAILSSSIAGGRSLALTTGVAAAPAPVAYGASTGVAPFRWSDRPRPDALPLPGNNQFELRVAWPGQTPSVSAVALALGPAATASPLLPQLQLLVDPARLLGIVPMRLDATAAESALALPLPPGLAPGTLLFAQSLHALAGGTIAASDGLRITTL